jgi:hypothetical protein
MVFLLYIKAETRKNCLFSQLFSQYFQLFILRLKICNWQRYFTFLHVGHLYTDNRIFTNNCPVVGFLIFRLKVFFKVSMQMQKSPHKHAALQQKSAGRENFAADKLAHKSRHNCLEFIKG